MWLGLHEPTEDEFAGVAELFGLHPLAVEDAVHAHQRPKVEQYGDVLFAVFKTVTYVEHGELTATSEVVDTGEIMVFTGPDFVVTVRHGRHGSLGPLREDLEADPEQLAKGPSAVLHALADHVVDDYLTVTDAVLNDIEEVETTSSPRAHREAPTPRASISSSANSWNSKGPCSPSPAPVPARHRADALGRRGDTGLLPRCRRPPLPRHRTGHRFDALLDSILQAHLAQVAVAQNEDMRKITAWAAIIAVPTMVCGVYGMNFDHMPELHWRLGYPLALCVIAAAASSSTAASNATAGCEADGPSTVRPDGGDSSARPGS